MGNGTQLIVQTVGKMTFEVVVDGRQVTVCFENVAFVPNLKINLLSVSQLRKKGYQIVFAADPTSPEKSVVSKMNKNSGHKILKGIEREVGLYELLIKPLWSR